MGVTTIEWTWRRIQQDDGHTVLIAGHTFNPWMGCLKIAKECQHCYAETFAHRWGMDVWGPAATTSRTITSPANWRKPLQWNAQTQAQGHRRSVFCASLADVFEDHPAVNEPRQRLWLLIEQTSWLNWLLLTKRPEHMLTMVPQTWRQHWPTNVWAGTSAGTQATAHRNIPLLLKVPAVVRFVSCEPQLEQVDLSPWLPSLQWVICGGESGTKARPFNPAWAQRVQEHCQQADVPFFFKQVGDGITTVAGGSSMGECGMTCHRNAPQQIPLSHT